MYMNIVYLMHNVYLFIYSVYKTYRFDPQTCKILTGIIIQKYPM